MQYEPRCPYFTEVEIKAWGEGLTAGLHTIGERNELNPYTSGDTCVAWATGFEAARYFPVPIDWGTVDWTHPGIKLTMWDKTDPATQLRSPQMLLNWSDYPASDKPTPDWKDNYPEHRSVPIDQHTLAAFMYRGIRDQVARIELPCPEYQFEANGNELTIIAGPFHKSGSKQEWEAVLDTMTREVEDLPNGLDVTDVSIDLLCTQPATARWSASVSVTDLLDNDERLSGDVWGGTADELEEAVSSALDNIDSSEVSDYYSDVEYEMDDWAEVEVEPSDLTYNLDDAVEL